MGVFQMAKISNIRFGFACNSSSSHSLISFRGNPDLSALDELNPEKIDGGSGYWRQRFYCQSREEKLQFLATILANSLDIYGYSNNGNIWKTKSDRYPEYLMRYYGSWVDGTRPASSIEHDSEIIIPCYFKYPFLNKEFFDELKSFLLDEKNVVISGPDEDSKWMKAVELLLERQEGVHSDVNKMRENRFTVAKHDPLGYWVLFNRKNGTRLRVAFDDNAEMRCASSPDLVDIKITDYCEHNCPFCYQGSSKDGRHAEYKFILKVIEALGELEVFEIAIGGGDPTKHPDFCEILYDCKNNNIVPNFTTRNYDWFLNNDNLKVFKETCGRVAFSADRISDLSRINAITTCCDIKDMVTVQVIDGKDDVLEIIKQNIGCLGKNLPITILGMKEGGRCTDNIDKYKNKHSVTFSEILDVAGYGCDIIVDTKYIKDHKKEIEDAEICRVLYYPEEGVYSMYIDAVEKTMNKSSYDYGKKHDILVPKYGDCSIRPIHEQIQMYFEDMSRFNGVIYPGQDFGEDDDD